MVNSFVAGEQVQDPQILRSPDHLNLEQMRREYERIKEEVH